MSAYVIDTLVIEGGLITGGTPLALTEGANISLTAGAGTYTVAVTGIGTTIQAYDADLAALAGLSSTGMIARTGAGTAAVRTITAGTGISISNGDGVSGNPTITCTVSAGIADGDI